MSQNELASPRPHLLIYAHYYHPDAASTGQLLTELAEGLLEAFRVTVICVVPSYHGAVGKEYRQRKYYSESINGVQVIRVRIPAFDKTRKWSRVKNILTYFFRAMWATGRVRDVQYVYSISQPPILGGLLGVWGKWTRRARYFYNIQDFNPEQIITTGYSKNKLILKVMLWLDTFSCKRADKVIVVGRDMVETLQKRFRGKRSPPCVFINNWADEKAIYPLPSDDPKAAAFRERYGLSGKYVIMYSGNLGLYYDLENILRTIAPFRGNVTSDRREIAFAFVGAGSLLKQLVAYKEARGLEHIVFIPYQDKADLNGSLNAADVHWCVSAKGIKGVSVPSKLYGIMAAGKPVLGVLEPGSEARLIMEETHCGLISDPGDSQQLEEHIRWFLLHAQDPEVARMGSRGRAFLLRTLTKEISLGRYAQEILGHGIRERRP